MQDLLDEQIANSDLICTFQRTMLKTPKEKRSIGWFKTQYDLLETYWKDFSGTHKRLLRYKDEIAKNPYVTDDVFDTTTSTYSVVKTMILGNINPGRNQSSLEADNSFADVAVTGPSYKTPLPPIELPTFDGNRLEWESFKGMYLALVHDVPSIPPILKLQYLIRSLTGEAANRLKNIQVTAENYEGAWKAIRSKYDNKKILLASHMSNVITCPSMTKNSATELNRVLDVVRESKQALDNLRIPADKLGELWLTHHVVHKFDSSTRLDWERDVDSNDDYPTYNDLVKFLERSIRVRDAARPTAASNSNTTADSKSPKNNLSKLGKVSAHATDTRPKNKISSCPCCQGKHSIYSCSKYKELQQPQRFEFCKKEKLCLNCLQNSHFLKDCPSKKKCAVCQAKHHSSLHSERSVPASNENKSLLGNASSSSSVNETFDTAVSHFSSKTSSNKACTGRLHLLATAQVVLADLCGNRVLVRALVDPGSERSFVKESVLSQLSPVFRKAALTVTVVGAVVASKLKRETTLRLRSNLEKSFCADFDPLVMGKLTDLLPKAELSNKTWPHIENLILADPTFHKPRDVDCILGADVYPLILLDGLIKGPVGTPVAQRTVFGWILTGASQPQPHCHLSSIRTHHTRIAPTLNNLVEKFWEIENLPYEKILTPEEQYCEEYFSKTTTRNPSGRFIVRLPFATKPTFTSSRDIAVACLFRSERRLAKNPLLLKMYSDFMHEYLDLKHMEIVPPSSTTRDSFYLPHHGVFRKEAPNKIRVVFNASQQAANKVSLNEVLLPGPKLQKDITTVLTRWRFFKYAFVTDIVKMFRQVLVHPDDVDWQRLVWRSTTDQAIQDYRALTVTYGTAPAPFLCLRVLQQLAEDGRNRFPEAATIIQHQTYVDDLFGGGDDVAATVHQRDQLIQLMASAGMELEKWSANRPLLLQGLSSESHEEVCIKVDEHVSTLGLKWMPQSDKFSFKSSPLSTANVVTKRTILSDVAKLFDPLGWLAPVLINAKILLQDLWLEKLDWDAPIQGELLQDWIRFRSSLDEVSSITVPRWLGGSESDSWQLHGFSDASKRAYAAAVYAVIPNKAAVLLMAKTRVAPIKVESLPRLELCGATLLARLANHLRPKLQKQPDQVHFWTDSKVVLDWLKGHPSRWQTFVANRVSEIITSWPLANWHHVRSLHNAADCATRGLSPQQLAESNLWWHGPYWLSSAPSEWPTAVTSVDSEEIEVKAFAMQETRSPNVQVDSDCLIPLQKFSKFSKILRILAYCGRWRFNARLQKEERHVNYITAKEFAWAKLACFRAIQHRHYSAELEYIKTKRSVPKRSNLVRLAPFLDEQGTLRVGGRLENAPLSFNERHPIILPSNDIIVKRLVEEVHFTTLHGGVRLMLAHLGQSLWITRAQPLVVGVYRSCIKCTRFNARAEKQQMGHLPADRLHLQRPFAVTGVDYAGPIPVLFSKGRGAKRTTGYVAIFICFVIKAVHIEIVSDLTTDAFLAAYARFAARRGVCKTLYSDNATTFKGASTELDRLFHQTSDFSKKVAGQLAIQGTEWLFIPPRAPHFGGLWEAAVKSFKAHFKKIIGDSTFTFEELSTLATKIEACLNARPICPLSTEPNDLTALTPAHFLVGSSTLALPEPFEEKQNISPQRRWKLLNQLRNSFWTRWKSDVLHRLQQRNKWLKPQPNLKVGDLVIIKDEISPPATWPLALVTELHPGKDGLVRVVTLKTSASTFTRPVVKLVKLPTQVEATEAYQMIQKIQKG